MSHANAPLTPEGRRRLGKLIVDEGWPIRRAADRYQVSPATASKWAKRYRDDQPLTDRSSRPHRSPNQLSKKRERRIIALRFTRRWGPHRISYHLGIPRSTVGRVLSRYRMPLLAHLDQATGLPLRKTLPVRYERSRPGELIHVDIKKLGRIPDGGGWRKKGRTIGNRNNGKLIWPGFSSDLSSRKIGTSCPNHTNQSSKNAHSACSPKRSPSMRACTLRASMSEGCSASHLTRSESGIDKRRSIPAQSPA